MATNDVTSAASIGAGATRSTLGDFNVSKDQFLKLLMAQLKYQDPMQPPDASKFTDQMTQFGQLEQMFNMNASLKNIAGEQGSTDRFQAVNFIGNKIDALGNDIEVKDTDKGSIGFRLDQPASDVAVHVFNSDGEEVRTVHYNDQAPGMNRHDFDGTNSAGAALPNGIYQMVITAESTEGNTLSVMPVSSGTVSGVEFAADGPKIKVGDRYYGMDQVLSVTH